MKSFGRRILLAGVAAACVGLGNTDANAVRFTEEATFQLKESSNIGTQGPPIPNVISLAVAGDAGGFYSNTYANVGGLMGTNTVNTVGAALLADIQTDPATLDPSFVTTPVNPGTNNQVVTIFALQGTASANPVPGSGIEDVFRGGAVVLDLGSPDGLAFGREDPTTWNFAGLNAANVLGIYKLAPRDSVEQGGGDNVSQTQANMNKLSFTDADPSTNEIAGDLLFDYIGTPNTSGLFPAQFQVNEAPLFGMVGTEGLYVRPDAQLESANIPDLSGNVAAQNLLNAIFAALLMDPTAEFADFGAAGIANYNPSFPATNTLDFFAQFDYIARPTSASDVPEPATAVFGLMGLAGLTLGARRRRQTA